MKQNRTHTVIFEATYGEPVGTIGGGALIVEQTIGAMTVTSGSNEHILTHS